MAEGMCGRGHAWHGGHVYQGVCMAGGVCGRGACIVGGAWQGCVHGGGRAWWRRGLPGS